jgi:hypothetical protein
VSRRDASRDWSRWSATVPDVKRSETRVRTAKLQPVIVQRSLLRTLMKDARRGSIR